MPHSSPWRACAAAALAIAGLAAAPAHAAIDPTAAGAIFAEARAICDRDGGAMWGRTLCGPILLVDPNDRAILANQADPGGVLKPAPGGFAGTLPESEILANTPLEWSGTRWTELIWPLTDDPVHRQVLLAHEMFHRIQPAVGMIRPEGGDQHLDTLEGRYLLQLEWRALAKALEVPDPAARRAAIADALLFRHERYRLFPDAAAEEAALEIDEGVPEYTGVRLGLETDAARTAFAVRDLSAFVAAPSFVRSFAYATGPAYGQLLDQADPDWIAKARAGKRFDELLGAALDLPAVASAAKAKARAAVYDADGRLRTTEVAREARRLARLAELKARLVQGPVLSAPLNHASYQFNPQTLQALGEDGIAYPTLRVSGPWGVLEAEDGALMDKAMTRVSVSAAGMVPSRLQGKGWRLTLKPGWTVQDGARPGDMVVREAGAAAR